MGQPTVAIILSTYNGGCYLAGQLQSILSQKGISATLIARDDGSADETRDLLENYPGNKKLIFGRNAGVGNSFMLALYEAGCSYDYYAFCDQDDIWTDDKTITAIKMLESESAPTLYCSNQLLVDERKLPMRMRWEKQPDTSYMQIMNNNKLSGCTMLWNVHLQRLLIDSKRRPSELLLRKRIHDVWVAMVAATCGTIVYDENSHIMYRQHEKNVVGVTESGRIRMWIDKLRNPSLRCGRSDLCKEIAEKYGDRILEKEAIEKLKFYGLYRQTLKRRLCLLSDSDITRYSGETISEYRAKVLLGLF